MEKASQSRQHDNGIRARQEVVRQFLETSARYLRHHSGRMDRNYKLTPGHHGCGD